MAQCHRDLHSEIPAKLEQHYLSDRCSRHAPNAVGADVNDNVSECWLVPTRDASTKDGSCQVLRDGPRICGFGIQGTMQEERARLAIEASRGRGFPRRGLYRESSSFEQKASASDNGG